MYYSKNVRAMTKFSRPAEESLGTKAESRVLSELSPILQRRCRRPSMICIVYSVCSWESRALFEYEEDRYLKPSSKVSEDRASGSKQHRLSGDESNLSCFRPASYKEGSKFRRQTSARSRGCQHSRRTDISIDCGSSTL